MATNFTSTTLPETFNDDYADSDNYHQILFRSGRALQARELTQLQTLIYREMSRFGSNIFKEGAVVNGGGLSSNGDYIFLQVHDTTGGTFASIPLGTVFTDGSIRARVLGVHPQDVSAGFVTDTLYIQYIDGGSTTVGSTPPQFAGGAEIVGAGYTLTLKGSGANPAVAPATSYTGRGVRVDTTEGDFFVLGRFVRAKAQSLIVKPYNDDTPADADIGFKVTQLVINVNDDAALYDNAGTNVNTASPGAERYQINLELTTRADVTDNDTFVFIGRIENGKVVEEVETNDSYNKINDLLATRTEEESGDYIVNPFTIDFDSEDANNLSLSISEGLAYVNGYRVENPSPIELIVPRSQSTELVRNDVIPVRYGNYIEIESSGILPDLDNFPVMTMYEDTIPSVPIGTTRVRAIEPISTGFRLYLFDLNIKPGRAITECLSIGTGLNNLYRVYAGATPANAETPLLGTTDNDLLMPTSRPRGATMDDVIWVAQRHVDLTAAAGVLTLQVLGGNETFASTGQWLIASLDNPGGFVVKAPTNITATTCETGLGGGDNDDYRLVYYVQTTVTTGFAPQTKTLTSANDTLTVTNDSAAFSVVDVQEITAIKQTDVNGVDVSERFIFDDGQRDNYYGLSKLILKEGETDPGTIYVEYEHLARSGNVNFFGPGSYSSLDYSEVPDHTLADGKTVSLRNFLDFRPDKTSPTTFANVKYLPASGTSVTSETNYYLPRADKLIATQEGDIQLLMGQQSKDPQLKPTPDNALELYQILMNANTHSPDDVQIRPIEHKRYTMKDIAQLEAKVDDLKAYTELNIAELRALHAPSLDSDGNERADAGFIVDDLSDQTGSDTDNDDYAASLDPENNLIRPMTDEDNIRLIMETDATLSKNVTKKGDNVYISYSDVDWKFQDIASGSVNVNPFGKVDNVGVIKLSPSSDEWKDSKEDAIKAIQGTSRLDTKQAFLWNNWQWNWKGRSNDDLWVSHDYGEEQRGAVRIRNNRVETDAYASNAANRNNLGYVRRVVGRDTLRRRIGRRWVDLALIPWIRSRRIFFKAQGLKPNTKFTPFFDGKDVSAWCKPEDTFLQYADRRDDNGNKWQYSSLTGHPFSTNQAGEELISDANGEVIGSFWIPNLRPLYYVQRRFGRRRIRQNYLRFRAGVREFKLLDISENNWAAADSKAFAYYTVQGSLWHKWRNILSTRPYQTRWPLGNATGFPAAFSPQELKKVLDGVNSTAVEFLAPQISGQYGPQTNPVTLSTLNGSMSQVLSDYINVNNKQFAGNNILPVSLPQNPLSQTFYVDNQFGVVLRKISLYFRKIDTTSNLPISIHIRPVVNGKPSETEIVPDSHVFLLPNSGSYDATKANAIGLEPTLSAILEKPSVFEFDEPVFLQPWTEYAIVITSASTDYQIFSAKTREPILGNPGRTVSTQPQLGKLFLPQAGLLWIESKDQDLMMKIERASFDLGGGTLLLKNAPLPPKMLDDNPLRFTQNSGLVTVNHPCHGHRVGDMVQLDSADIDNLDAAIRGTITDAAMNTKHKVTAQDLTGYQFTIAGGLVAGADGTASVGGEKVLANRNANFDAANPTIETIIPNFTSAEYSAKFITGAYTSQDSDDRFLPNGEDQSMLTAKFEKITPDVNIEFEKPRAIFHEGVVANTTASYNSSGLGKGTAGETESVYIKVDLKTSNDYVSPIIDLQRCSLALAGQCIQDSSASSIVPVSETSNGASTGSRHITPPVTLEVPAVGIDARADLQVPEGAGVDFYYRTCTGDMTLADQPWVYQSPERSVPNTGNGQFTGGQFLPGGKNGTLPPFTQVQTKYVMKGTAKGPVLKNIATRFLAT